MSQSTRAAALIAKLQSDPELLAEFHARPDAVLARHGLDSVLSDSGPRTLEARESRSALAGLMAAAAVEGLALAHQLLPSGAPASAAAPMPAPPAPAPAPPLPLHAVDPAPKHGAGAARTGAFQARAARHEPHPRRLRSVPGEDAPSAGAPTPFADEIDAAAARHRLDPALLRGLIRQESNFDPRAASPAGAQGLCQLMPATARGLGVSDPFDPAQSIDAGARYLRTQLDRFADVSSALAAYNAGPGNVERFGGVPPFAETQQYVKHVLAYAREYRDAAPAAAAHAAEAPPAPRAHVADAPSAPRPDAHHEAKAQRSGAYEIDRAEPKRLDAAPHAAPERGTGERVVDIARRELGTAEQSPNDGSRIAVYRGATIASAPGQPWCAYFVSWVARQAGRPLGDAAQGFGAVKDLWAWGQEHDRAITAASGARPRPGDLVVFTNPPFKHVGIVEKVLPDGSIRTIEGNYGDRVSRVVHAPGDDILGYVRMR